MHIHIYNKIEIGEIEIGEVKLYGAWWRTWIGTPISCFCAMLNVFVITLQISEPFVNLMVTDSLLILIASLSYQLKY